MITFGKYKELIKAKLLGDSEFLGAIKELVPTDMPRHEAQRHLVKLWDSSLQPDIELTHNCSCGKVHRFRPNFNHLMISEIKPLEYKLDGFKLILKWPNFFTEPSIPGILTCIDYIVVGNDKVKLDELTASEEDTLCESLTEDHISNVKSILYSPELILATPVKCECGTQSVNVLKGFKDIFSLM
ncbi:baseplate hub assembly chaperone [Shewanella phage Thanatos-1]|nr:baseplate hub assembly chaperone [Shewanella phage Thanatos-1]QLA10592.1 baseplate hub assembly chaperone [Shewanella phage Thanatos-2]